MLKIFQRPTKCIRGKNHYTLPLSCFSPLASPQPPEKPFPGSSVEGGETHLLLPALVCKPVSRWRWRALCDTSDSRTLLYASHHFKTRHSQKTRLSGQIPSYHAIQMTSFSICILTEPFAYYLEKKKVRSRRQGKQRTPEVGESGDPRGLTVFTCTF